MTRCVVILCLLASGHEPISALQMSREEMNRKHRREEAETDREWARKYEADWKAYLANAGKPYRTWRLTKISVRKEYQQNRLSRGLERLPFRHLHR